MWLTAEHVGCQGLTFCSARAAREDQNPCASACRRERCLRGEAIVFASLAARIQTCSPIKQRVQRNVALLQGFADAKTVEAFVDKIRAAGNTNATLYVYSGEGAPSRNSSAVI